MKTSDIIRTLAFVAFCTVLHSEPLDIMLTNGRIVDGTGAPWYVADVGIKDGRIVRIGRLDGE